MGVCFQSLSDVVSSLLNPIETFSNYLDGQASYDGSSEYILKALIRDVIAAAGTIDDFLAVTIGKLGFSQYLTEIDGTRFVPLGK